VAEVAPAALELSLHRAMRVRHVRIAGRPAPYERDGDILRVSLIARESVIDIAYSGTPATGLYAAEAAGQRVVFTDAWPQRGAGWLPAVHQPSDPATLALAIEAPAAWDVVGSGVHGEVTSLPDNHRRWRFALDAAAPVYTFAFAAARFTTVLDSTGSTPVAHHLLRADSAGAPGLARVATALDTLGHLLGPYSYRRFATVQVPHGFDGMENAGAAFLRAGLYRGAGRSLESVAFHEAAHQWLGNRFVPADWRDLWLAEGAATYLSTVLYERLDGAEAGREHRVMMVDLEDEDAGRVLRPAHLDAPADALSGTVYGKGGSVFHLLRLLAGDDAFFGVLRGLVAEARPVSTEEFQRAFEQTAGSEVAPLFDYWVHSERVPVLRTDWDSRTRTLTWRLEGDDGTLSGLPIQLSVRQVGAETVVPLAAGRVRLARDSEPEVRPDGVVMRVR
jgi:aminopeptidase N